MNWIIWLLTLLATLGIPTISASEDLERGDPLTLAVGQQMVLSGKQLTQVSVGNAQIAQAKLTNRNKQILLSAIAPGTTDLVLWDRGGGKRLHPVWVIPGQVHEHAQELRALLADLENIHLRQVGERTIIEGKALRQEDLQRVAQAAKLYPNVTNLVDWSDEVQPILTEEINQKLAAFGIFEVRAKALGRKIFLTGEVSDETQRKQALTIAQMLFADTEDLLQLGNQTQPLIRLNLTLLEVNRSNLQHLGIRWPEMAKAIGKLELGSNLYNYGLTGEVTGILDLVQKKGWGRVLTQPSLLCRSGETAHFLAGGEIPIKLISERTANILFKPYGIILNMSPQRTLDGTISLHVETEVSALDGSNSIEDIPAFLTRKLTSTVSVASGQSLVLGGLTDQLDLKSVDRVPYLANVPILGELFKSRRFRSGVSDLLIFIQPTILARGDAADTLAIDKQLTKEMETQQWLKPKLND